MSRLGLVQRVCLLLLCSVQLAAAHDATVNNPNRALLVLDRVVSGALVAGRNTTVEYVIANVGTGAATSVSLKDLSFPSSRFRIHGGGSFRASFGRLSPAARVSHVVVMTPKRAGELLVSPASVSYVDGGGESRVTRLAADDTVLVEDLLAFRRRTDTHQREWALYAVAFLVCVVAPAVLSARLQDAVGKEEAAKKKM